VTDQDIANIVAQWTGIPVEKARPHLATSRSPEHCTGYDCTPFWACFVLFIPQRPCFNRNRESL